MENFVVSARKYRPLEFDAVVGQSHITNTLEHAITNNQLAQALLFCGPRGVGKTTCARILARKINEKYGETDENSINEGNITVYALCTDDCSEEHHADSHIHFCCKNCKKIFCMHSVKTPYVNIPSGFIAEKLDIIVHGLCVECSKIT